MAISTGPRSVLSLRRKLVLTSPLSSPSIEDRLGAPGAPKERNMKSLFAIVLAAACAISSASASAQILPQVPDLQSRMRRTRRQANGNLAGGVTRPGRFRRLRSDRQE